MRIAVTHLSRYEYDVPVTLGQHTLRLLPQVPTRSSSLYVSPVPIAREERFDEFDNRVLSVAFYGQTRVLSVESRFELETQVPPFSRAEALYLPLLYTEPGLRPYIQREGQAPSVVEYARQLAEEAGNEAGAFADRLTQDLYRRIDRRVRLEGAAQSASETLGKRQGACRDLTVLFMAACRSQGLAARFVSGYQVAAETVDGQRYLHAWPEIHFPGYGWRGYDPTHGLAVDEGHIALCAGPHQAATMPVEGGFSFAGQKVNSTLTFSVDVTVVG